MLGEMKSSTRQTEPTTTESAINDNPQKNTSGTTETPGTTGTPGTAGVPVAAPLTVIRDAGNDFLIATTPSGHAFTVDVAGKRHSAPGPLELFIAGLAACTATDVISILQKKREPVTAYRLEVQTERRTEHPRSFTRIMLKHVVRGKAGGKGVSAEAVARAIELSTTKYCSALSTVRPTAEIVTSYEIEAEL
jgi:putative redox protein